MSIWGAHLFQKNLSLQYLYREQAYDVLFEGDEEGKSIATLLLEAIINVRLISHLVYVTTNIQHTINSNPVCKVALHFRICQM